MIPSASASAAMSMASWPLVRNSRSGGSPMAEDLAGSSIWAGRDPLPGADQRMPGMLADVGQVHGIDPVGDLPGAAQVLPLDPGRGRAGLLLAGLIQRPDHQLAPAAGRRAAPARPATANRRTAPIAAEVSQTARLSSRWVLSGARSPACSAIVQPLRLASPPASALRYFPACSHGSGRAKQGRSRPSSSRRFRAASRAPILRTPDTTITLTISAGPRKGQAVSLRQVTRRVPGRGGGTRQIHALTSRTDLAAGEVCWRLTSRWREENYFRYARTHFALDALDSHAATPDDPDRKVPNPARKAAAAQVRHAEILAAAAQAQRDASLAALRNPPPGQPVTITNQMINALDTPAEAAWQELQAAQDAAAAVPARIRLGEIAPDMVRLETEVKQITHAIRMAAYNAETTLARALDGHYARAGDEAYALIREALTTSGDIRPGNGQLLIRLDPLTAPRRTQALTALCDQLNQTQTCYPGTDLVLRYEVKPHPGTA